MALGGEGCWFWILIGAHRFYSGDFREGFKGVLDLGAVDLHPFSPKITFAATNRYAHRLQRIVVSRRQPVRSNV